ncbi:MAG: Chaperone protein DnaJ [Wolbachia endosymbiont of Ctenocephalides orientis wCori]|nr:MAG: Chaperone protein DnaJ [Wolbachia endosymbiont of Ctenocephalides orientis wCori]
MPGETYYEILEIRENASQSKIREAYKKLALKLHPDKNLSNIQEATEKFKEIKKIYETLYDPSKRALYDEELKKVQQEELKRAQQLKPVWFDVESPVESFTGRKEELKDLHSKMQGASNASRTTVITGLGGIGKSELAREYAYQYYKHYDGNMIWINAESYETLVKSFRTLARNELKIKTETAEGKERDISSIVRNVYEYFGDRKSLFIFDNATQMRSTEKGNNGIMDFLPFCLRPVYNKPYILITSCNQKWNKIEKLPLSGFHEKEATELIKRELEITDSSQDRKIKQLAETLGYFPLALQQAIDYIEDRRITGEFEVSDYLKEYDSEAKKLLNFTVFHLCSSYTQTAFTVWKVTLDKIKDEKEYGKQALEILDVMAYFSHKENISREIFLNLVNGDDRKLKRSVRLPVKCSMVNGEQCQSILSVNKLVQDVLQLKLKEQGKEEEVLSKALDLLKKLLQEGKFDKAFSHAESVLDHASAYKGLKKKCEEVKSLLLPRYRLYC